jgi:PAS domain S-box-containing protein
MDETLRVLIVEDDSADAELMVRELSRAGYAPQWTRVETEAEYVAGLDEKPDIILSDSNLPQFDGIRALDLVRQRGLDIPFVLVSGRVGEDLAVDAMKQGAQDYLLKDRLARLGEAVRRAMEQRRVRAEKAWALDALRQSEERYRLVSEITSDYAYALAVDANGDLTCEWMTAPFTRISGYTREEIESRAWMSQYHADDLRAMESHKRTLLANKSNSIEARITTKEGKVRWVRIYGRPMWDEPAGRVTRIYGAAQDITAQKELEQKFQQAQKMEAVGRLAGGVAHDFNNLLTVIKGYADDLRQQTKDGGSDQVQCAAEQIMGAAERASQLTKQLLAFSRQQVLQPKTVDLNRIVASIEKLLQPLIGPNVEFTTILATEPALVRADPTQLEQVIVNFVVNARDSMPSGGRLTIEVATTALDREALTQIGAELAPGPYVVLAVSDTGIGMDRQTMQRIFEPFFTTKETGKGVGLGLATVDGIVRQSGGHIWVTSEPNAGTTFAVYLPQVTQVRAQLVGDATEDAEKGNGGEMRGRGAGGSEAILLVEDDRTLRTLMRRVLAGAGYQVLESNNVEEALQICERHEGAIALLVTDVVMPVMSGPQLAERALKMRPAMKVLFSSGYPGPELEARGLKAQEINLFEKPFTPDGLIRKVREVLAGSGWPRSGG